MRKYFDLFNARYAFFFRGVTTYLVRPRSFFHLRGETRTNYCVRLRVIISLNSDYFVRTIDYVLSVRAFNKLVIVTIYKCVEAIYRNR